MYGIAISYPWSISAFGTARVYCGAMLSMVVTIIIGITMYDMRYRAIVLVFISVIPII